MNLNNQVTTELENVTLQSVFNQGCKQFSQHTAFRCGTQSLSYLALDQDSRNFAAYIQNYTDLQPGDRIALQLPNCLAYPIVAWGALRAGLILVNINPLYTANELRHIYQDSGAKALFVLSSSIELVTNLVNESDISALFFLQNQPTTLENLHVDCCEYAELLSLGSQSQFHPVPAKTDDTALLQYTGGTTGLSKAAVLTHENLVSAAHSFWHTTAVFEAGNEVFAAPLPLYHVYAFVGHIMVGVIYGVTSILITNPRDLPALYNALKDTKFSLFVGINTLFNMLCHDPQFRTLDFSGLKFTLSGGMALDQSVALCWEALTQCQINEGYGLTESSAGVIINRGQHDYRLGSVGKPMQGVKIKIIGDNNQVIGPGGKGELFVKGKQIMKEYWHNPEATKASLQDGWLATGDIATMDEDGFVYIVDRIKDMILVSGFNVYPAEIEQVVNRLDDVQESAAIAITSKDTGEAVQLFVVRKQNSLTERDIIDHCRSNLAAYKIPKIIKFIDELPKSPVGKILKRELTSQN
ncbi:AMP-binding protein [Aliiglaciecola sp. 3_MG-2023]|uniref:AMP-binding protein n=1 Tax=Aliiglaciecola sp. 3_MG-2023 TaxID=3062644 RepID=UPI0026E3620B|nr:AMP-binding protein [Aliiglaciecola sp. 3_MG-2023]MDO6694483.1 AMP-binding protein [Aliiglaciecola sp. 3_MG-2023]